LTSVEALFADLERLDVKLWLEGGGLRFSAPKGALTPALRERLASQKTAIIDYLGTGQGQDGADPGESGQGRIHPPSFAQRHFGNLQRLNPSDCFYNIPLAFRLSGTLDLGMLRRSFEAMVGRHDFLRTTLQEIDGALMQVVMPAAEENREFELPVVELSHLPSSEQGDAVEQEIRKEWRRPFDLSRESGLRVRLLRLAEDDLILLFCVHNVLFETGSMRALLHELGSHYADLSSDKPCSLPPLPMQYADAVRWQQSLLASGMDQRLDYWREWFAKGEPPLLTLAIAQRSEPPTAFEANTLPIEIGPELTVRLKSLSQQAGVSLFIPLLTAYAVVLHRFSGNDDVVMATTFANRSHWKLEPLIGSLLNIIALRFDLSGNPDYLALLRYVRDVVLTAFARQDVPFETVATVLQLEQRRKVPLFRTVFSFFEETPYEQLQLPGVAVTYLDTLYCDVMRPDIYPALWEKKIGGVTTLKGYWQYKRELYEEPVASLMLRDYYVVLEAMTADPAQRIDPP
jgi:hypothetical protein